MRRAVFDLDGTLTRTIAEDDAAFVHAFARAARAYDSSFGSV